MDAMKRLEQAGFKFGLGDGLAVYHFDPGDGGPPMSQRPREVQQVMYESYAADLAEVRARPDEVKAVIMARSEWEATYDDYSAWLTEHDPAHLSYEEAEEDYTYQVRLAEVSEAAHWPFYDGAPVDKGHRAWRLMAEALRFEYEMARRQRLGAGSTRAETTSDDKEKQTMGIKIEQTKFVVLPEGEYKLRIVEIAEAEGKFHDQLQVKLEVANGPHAGTTFYSWMNRVFSPKSKLYMWVEAALAVPVPPDYDLDTDDLLDREVTGYVIVKPLDGGGEVNRVERVRAAREANRFERARTIR